MVSFEQLLAEIRNGHLAPVYILAGEEPWYIDKLCDAFESQVLKEEEKAFDFSKHYGKGLVKQSLLADCRSFPLQSSRRLVILREAHDAEKDKESADFMEFLSSYFRQPTRTTILVIGYKAKPDKRRNVWKNLLNHPNIRFFNSEKPKEQQVPGIIQAMAHNENVHFSADAVQTIMELVGTDLVKLHNEIQKLAIGIPASHIISRDEVIEKVSFSRQFNIFEFYKALARKDKSKILQIGLQMARNSRENPLIKNINQVFAFYSNLLLFMYYIKRENMSPDQAAQKMNLNFYSKNDYLAAINTYSFEDVRRVLHLLLEYDLKAKGLGARVDDEVLMSELTLRLAG